MDGPSLQWVEHPQAPTVLLAQLLKGLVHGLRDSTAVSHADQNVQMVRLKLLIVVRL